MSYVKFVLLTFAVGIAAVVIPGIVFFGVIANCGG